MTRRKSVGRKKCKTRAEGTLRVEIQRQRINLGKGLSQAQAWRQARRRATLDFRGMKYDRATGWAVLT